MDDHIQSNPTTGEPDETAQVLQPALRRCWRVSGLAQLGGLVLGTLFFALILRLEWRTLGVLAGWIGPLLILLASGWILVLRRLSAPLRDLAVRIQPAPVSPEVLRQAYRSAHGLPYRVAALSIAGWLLLQIALGLAGGLQEEELALRWAGMVLASFVISFGVMVYQLIGQRLAIRPVLERLSVLLAITEGQARVPPAAGAEVTSGRREPWQLRVRYSLRFKMIFSFTGLVFFACALALFLTFTNSRELIDELQGAHGQERVLLLAQLVRRQDPITLGAGEGLVLISDQQEVLRSWGRPIDRPLLRELAGLQPGKQQLSPRGLVAVVAESGAGLLPADDARSGRLILVIPRPPLASRNLRLVIVFMSLLFLGAVGLVHLSAREITGPIQELAERAREMAQGRLERPVPVGEADEIGILAGAFETMRTGLKEKLETIEDLNLNLEQKVRTRTQELEQALEQLQASELKLVQSEKMASLGQLVAGVAHEINNPVNFILNTIDPLGEIVRDLLAALEVSSQDQTGTGERRVAGQGLTEAGADALRMLSIMRNGAERTRRIVADLRSFSRLEEAELKEVRLEEGLASTLNLLRPSIPPGVELVTHFELDRPVVCYASQLNQVFMNLLNNAIQAVGAHGQVEVRAFRDADWAVVQVEDDGPGIPAAIRHRIFDPFFTTKEIGQGTGLGLSISLGIVARHGGELKCESEPGQGARFILRIPVAGPPGRP